MVTPAKGVINAKAGMEGGCGLLWYIYIIYRKENPPDLLMPLKTPHNFYSPDVAVFHFVIKMLNFTSDVQVTWAGSWGLG